jgi:2-dehydro-3-deoxygalactonokinase
VTPRLIGVDWGTTSLRCYLVDRTGAVLARQSSGQGILSVPPGEFGKVLANLTQAWRSAHPGLPIVLSGMIGSRQGWHEVAYVRCPARLIDLADAIHRIDYPGLPAVMLIPGLDTRNDDGVPDVMRGEETQVFGALVQRNLTDGTFVLPGTHSKWVHVRDGAIAAFATFMTGEVFAALCGHTILGRLMTDKAGCHGNDSFLRGVRASTGEGGPGALLNQIFSARTLGLFDMIPGNGVRSYLSGLLIGSEIRSGHRTSFEASPIHIIGNPELGSRYAEAARALEVDVEIVDGDCIAYGHLALADQAQL